MDLQEFLRTVGLFSLLIAVYNVGWFLVPFFNKPKLDRYLKAVNGKPAWALVTGASDGIGKGLANELAHRGFNVVLHGRNDVKLEEVRHKLALRHPEREFRIMVGDAGVLGAGSESWDLMLAPLENLNLRVLINNVGGCGQMPMMRRLDESSMEDIAVNVHMNALFPTILNAIMIPRFSSSAEPALIINVGSLADGGWPLLSFYSGSKSYVNSISASMARELRMDGIDVEVIGVRIGAVATKTDLMSPRLFWPSVETIANAILDRVGCGRSVLVPYWPHLVQILLVDMVPLALRNPLYSMVFNRMRYEEKRIFSKDQ
ncbi:Very-long-chain 3-oxooacyl-coA reductase [Colletotrichum siamense]|uniref:Very-long-chain 3-oxooacyl-coA reductase n=1 Tax=Colletotrichum siamense TaxID=690259 RepID=A0A9P5F4L1_COLSI|nr:Very-long-chain 3-oxooacyl-coA reductase [Colletotrichum siamense]KAF4866873.1 Very-long-chain 3-oxooacyl-coA reductase [Colletotrichum siamense]